MNNDGSLTTGLTATLTNPFFLMQILQNPSSFWTIMVLVLFPFVVKLLLSEPNLETAKRYIKTYLGINNEKKYELIFFLRSDHISNWNAQGTMGAWMEFITEKLKEKFMKQENVGPSAFTKIHMSQIFYNEIVIPIQHEPFLIQEPVFGKILIVDIQDVNEFEDGRRNSRKRQEITLTLFVKNEHEYKTLLDLHEKVCSDYLERQKRGYTERYVFELQPPTTKHLRCLWTKTKYKTNRRMEDIWFPQKDEFVNLYDKFVNGQEEYAARGEPWTFSAFLYGVPGAGKTSLLKAIANSAFSSNPEKKKQNIPAHLFIVSFANVWNRKMLSSIFFEEKVYIQHPDDSADGFFINIPLEDRVFIFEDFDACEESASIFRRRDYVDPKINSSTTEPIHPTNCSKDFSFFTPSPKNKEENNLSSSPLTSNVSTKKKGKDEDDMEDIFHKEIMKRTIGTRLSLLDILTLTQGMNDRNGQRMFFTTNCDEPKEYFDPAFLRPGRQDILIKFEKISREGIRYLLERRFKVTIDEKELMTIPDKKWSPAEIVQKCNTSSDWQEVVNKLSLL